MVIANPSFSLKNWGADTWSGDSRAVGGIPPTGNGDYAWVQHMVASMKPGTGQVGVVMPHGVLFRGGAEARIREALLTSDRLDAVIGLPANLFYSTSIPACVLLFRATKPVARRLHVPFIDGSARFAVRPRPAPPKRRTIVPASRAEVTYDGRVDAACMELSAVSRP